jgi:hypothetical protein
MFTVSSQINAPQTITLDLISGDAIHLGPYDRSTRIIPERYRSSDGIQAAIRGRRVNLVEVAEDKVKEIEKQEKLLAREEKAAAIVEAKADKPARKHSKKGGK